MPTTRIPEVTRKLLHRLSKDEGNSMHEIVAKSLEEYRRNKFLERSNKAYAKLRQRKEDWGPTLQNGLNKDLRI